MKLTVEDLLKHSFVITIDRERHSLFKRIFKAHGMGKPCPKKFQGVTIWYNSPQYNCSLSHAAAIEKAKKLKWPYVCIFEDDAYPVTGVKDELEKYLSEIPDDCAVLVLGSIFCHGSLGLQGNFLKGIRVYGGHSYILFRDYYDKYLELLAKFPEGDGPLYKTDKSIIPLGQFYGTGRNLFIQYSPENGMNNKSGYILYYSMKNWNWIKFPDEYIFHKGFPKVEELLGKTVKQADFPQIVPGKPLVFVTVNAGTNALTNITAKSILMFHPTSKILVVDVPKTPDLKFVPCDESIMKNVEVVNGIGFNDIGLPTIDIYKAKNITELEKAEIAGRFGSDRIEVLPNGDFHHPTNIQFAMDCLDENFVVIDSDAPLISPVDFIDGQFAAIAQQEHWNYMHLDRLRPLVRPEVQRMRFDPCIQYINVEMLKEHGLKYFDKDWLQDNLFQAGWFKNPCCGGKESIFYWTGSLFHSKVLEMGLPWKEINFSKYVDHLGGGTWADANERKTEFIRKYSKLLNIREEKDMKMTSEGVLVQRSGVIRQGLLDFISSIDMKDMTMIEVGSYAGESSDMFASSGKVNCLWCIDPWQTGYDENDRASSSNMVAAEKAFDKVVEKHPETIHKYKGVLEGFIKDHPEVHPDLIYIDACHTYEGCKNDIINALKLNPKIISGHDYAGWLPDVIKAVDEVLGKPDMTFCDGSWIKRLS